MLKHGCFTSPFFLRPILSIRASLLFFLILSCNLSCESPKAQQHSEPVSPVSSKLRPRSSAVRLPVIDLYLALDSKEFSAIELHSLESYLVKNRSAYLPCLKQSESVHRSIAVQLELLIKEKGLHLNRMNQSPKDSDLEKCLRQAFWILKDTSLWRGKTVNLAFIAAQVPESLPWWAGRSWSKAIGLTLEKEDSKLRPDVLE